MANYILFSNPANTYPEDRWDPHPLVTVHCRGERDEQDLRRIIRRINEIAGEILTAVEVVNETTEWVGDPDYVSPEPTDELTLLCHAIGITDEQIQEYILDDDIWDRWSSIGLVETRIVVLA